MIGNYHGNGVTEKMTGAEDIPQTELIRELNDIITNLEKGAYCNNGVIEKEYNYDDYNILLKQIDYTIKLSIIPRMNTIE